MSFNVIAYTVFFLPSEVWLHCRCAQGKTEMWKMGECVTTVEEITQQQMEDAV